jgi:hypothetical protein
MFCGKRPPPDIPSNRVIVKATMLRQVASVRRIAIVTTGSVLPEKRYPQIQRGRRGLSGVSDFVSYAMYNLCAL